MDSTIVSTALPTIVGDLGGADHLSWVITAYMLTETIGTALAGKLGDLFGRKNIFMASIVIFVGSSALAGMAHTMTLLIIGRGLQGIGGGGLMVTATAMIADVIPLRERGKYQGALGGVFGVTTVIGPLLGGLFTDHLSWRWAFYVNVPLALLILVVAVKVLPSVKSPTKPIIDYLGIAFISIASTMVVLATSWGGTQYAWGSSMIIGLFIGAVVFLALFVWAESRATAPIMPLRLFSRNTFSVTGVLSLIVGFAFMGAMAYLPTFLQYSLGVSATESGLRTLPMVVGLMITSTTAGNYVSKTGRYKMFPIAGTAVMAVGLWLLSQLSETSSVWTTSFAMLIFGAGVGLTMQILVIVVQNTVDYADLGVATSAVSFFRTMGSTFGAAVFGTIYSNLLAERLPAALAETRVQPSAVSSPEAINTLTAAQQVVIRHAYASSLTEVFMWAIPVAIVGLLLALLLKQVPLRDLVQPAAADMGHGFGMPDHRSNVNHLEGQVARILRNENGRGLRERVLHADLPSDVVETWVLTELVAAARQGVDATRMTISRRHFLPPEVVDPSIESAIGAGLVSRTDDRLQVTETGQAAFSRFVDVMQDHLAGEVERQCETTLSGDERAEMRQIVIRMVTAEHFPGMRTGRHAIPGATALDAGTVTDPDAPRVHPGE